MKRKRPSEEARLAQFCEKSASAVPSVMCGCSRCRALLRTRPSVNLAPLLNESERARYMANRAAVRAEAHALMTTPKKTKPLIVSGTQFAMLVGVHPKTISGWVALDDAHSSRTNRDRPSDRHRRRVSMVAPPR